MGLLRGTNRVLNVNEDRFSNNGFPAYDLEPYFLPFKILQVNRLTKRIPFFEWAHFCVSTVDPCQKLTGGLPRYAQKSSCKNRPVINPLRF